MTRVLAALVWPIALADTWYTNRRTTRADQQRAADMARIASCGNGTCCHTRPTLRDDQHGWD